MNKDRQHIDHEIEARNSISYEHNKGIFKCVIFHNYVNLEIVWHTALSDAWYLKIKCTLVNRNLLLHNPYAEVFTDILVRVFGKGTKYFKKSSIKSKL